VAELTISICPKGVVLMGKRWHKVERGARDQWRGEGGFRVQGNQ
jgi:hypothetical protein